MFSKPDKTRIWLHFAILIVFLSAMLGIGNLVLKNTVQSVITANAERKAQSWAEHLSQTMPALETLIETGEPSSQQRELIQRAVHIADVFRFKLFDAEARMVLISDELGQPLEHGATTDHNGNAEKVLETGNAIIDVNDGTQKQNRPDLYVEAYVPVHSRTGSTIGVVEVYLDQTPVAALFRRNFLTLAVALGLVVLVSFSVPFVAYVIKMRQQARTTERVRQLSSRDQLTGLYNRATFFQRAEEAGRLGKLDLSNAAVIYIDLDKFKVINDRFGHKAGDAFLRHVGNAISVHLTSDDLAARLGGDEFIFVSGNRTMAEVAVLIESLRDMVSQPLRTEGVALTAHLSLGVHHDVEANLSLPERMHKADIALYQAKVSGRDNWVLFTPELEERIARRQFVEECVVGGFASDSFEIHYQPLIEQSGANVVGFEALLRLKDPEGNAITPAEFIPVAEEAGEIGRIGTWVLENAIRTAVTWPEPYFVSVNLSARQFEDGGLVDTVARLLQQTGLAPERLELEITENALIENEDSISGQLAGLSRLGVSLAIDDFGTGYSSLGYLWKHNFKKLKVDQTSVMSEAGMDEEHRHILNTIISLGHHLNLAVTVEGIETEEQVRVLNSLSCDHLQGFYYGVPMPARDLAPYVLNASKVIAGAKIGPFAKGGETAGSRTFSPHGPVAR